MRWPINSHCGHLFICRCDMQASGSHTRPSPCSQPLPSRLHLRPSQRPRSLRQHRHLITGQRTLMPCWHCGRRRLRLLERCTLSTSPTRAHVPEMRWSRCVCVCALLKLPTRARVPEMRCVCVCVCNVRRFARTCAYCSFHPFSSLRRPTCGRCRHPHNPGLGSSGSCSTTSACTWPQVNQRQVRS